MNKTVIKIALLAVIILGSEIAFAITASEVFNDGKRAFDSGRWQEASEIFDRFMVTWPEDKLKSEALYHYAISSARNLEDQTRIYRNSLVDSLASSIATLSKELPEKDLSELKVAIKLAKAETLPATWADLTLLPPTELKHYLARSWHPDPYQTPMEALYWSVTWVKNNKKPLDPELVSSIALIKARALWQIMLSPLSTAANLTILKKWQCWPVHKHFEDALRRGFGKGNPATKRELALLGYHYDCFRSGYFSKTDPSPVKSRWYTYLSERGINLQEAWCPR